MTTLFPHAEMLEIVGKALAAGLAQRSRAVLLAGIDPLFVDRLQVLNVPADQLHIDVEAMNRATSPLSSGIIPLQIWLTNAAFALQSQPAAADFFTARAAAIVPQTQPDPAETEQLARDHLEKVTVLAKADVELRAAIRQVSGKFESMANRLRPFAALKNIHDQLHQFQMGALPMLQASVRLGSRDVAQMAAKSAAKSVAALMSMAGAEIENLVNAQEKAEQTDHLDQLGDMERSLEAAAAAADNTADPARDALIDLRVLVKGWMADLNLRLSYNAYELNIPGLIDDLRLFTEALPLQDPRAEQLRAAATQLSLLHSEIETLLAEHDRWQDIDNELWTIEEYLLFSDDNVAKLRAFERRWPQIVKKVERIAGPEPAIWYADTRKHADTFDAHCKIPVTPPVQAKAIEGFGDFISSARTQFFEVDTALKRRCNLLVALTGPLQQLARTP